jgi:hypothetical protein
LDLEMLGLGKSTPFPNDDTAVSAPLVTVPTKREVRIKLLGVPLFTDPQKDKFGKTDVSVLLMPGTEDAARMVDLGDSLQHTDVYPQFVPAQFVDAVLQPKSPFWGEC